MTVGYQASLIQPRTDPSKRSFEETVLEEALEEELVSVMSPEEDANPPEAQSDHLCPNRLSEMNLYRKERSLTLLENHRCSRARSAY